MEQKKVTRDFKVLTEKISPDNVAVMAELIHSHARDQSAHRILWVLRGKSA